MTFATSESTALRGDGPIVQSSTSAAEMDTERRHRPLPKTPIVDWTDMAALMTAQAATSANSIEAVSHRLMTTSGRAALYQALKRIKAARGGHGVLVPTYHCPSMIAPIVDAGLSPIFVAVHADGTPRLEDLSFDSTQRPAAMIAAHYFGLPRSLAAERAWCDEYGVALVEDCAHCFFGQGGTRTVGQWGDYAIASLTKFFALPEAGLLVSSHNPLKPEALKRPAWRAQVKGCIDVLEMAARHGRPRGVSAALRIAFGVKNWLRRSGRQPAAVGLAESADRIASVDCDMARADDQPLWISERLFHSQGRDRIFARRRENFMAYASALTSVPGARAMHCTLPDAAAPYVFPLLVDDAEHVYAGLRNLGMPVYRWDRVWPETPNLPNDNAHYLREHLLQLLCHQDLTLTDVGIVCQTLLQLLSTTRRPVALALKP